jgi:hypothetical protein
MSHAVAGPIHLADSEIWYCANYFASETITPIIYLLLTSDDSSLTTEK